MMELKHELLYEAHFDLVDRQMVGTPNGLRVIVLVGGGWIRSPKFGEGQVLPGAGDWLRVRNDGVSEIDVRATIKLDDDNLCFITYGGVSHIAPDVYQRILKGEDIDPSAYYFRVTPRFQTASEKYSWLNNVICVASGKIAPYGAAIQYTGFEIL
ncbi:MAG: DUF3237 domain-containing protein [Phototrophicaceae bacterium]